MAPTPGTDINNRARASQRAMARTCFLGMQLGSARRALPARGVVAARLIWVHDGYTSRYGLARHPEIT
jgi:hypothetical protein